VILVSKNRDAEREMSDTARGPADPWNETTLAAAEEAGIRELARLLELRGQGADQATIRAAYLDLLEIRPGEQVVDVGCGTGVVTRAVGRRVAPRGRVVGVDPSPTLLSVAREIAERDGLLGQVDFRVADARSLPFEDGAFDVALAITALSHTTDAEQALPELLRVVRPGGRVGVFDIDPDSWIIAHPDRVLTRRICDAASDIITDGWLGRRLPAMLEAAGLEAVQVRAFTPVERDPAGYYARLAEMRAGQAVRMGAISEEERASWLATLRAEQAAGRYLSGLTHLFIWGRRPES
jgi:ubiquinone/menaquinone biosynthesis C-methylase UbiE